MSLGPALRGAVRLFSRSPARGNHYLRVLARVAPGAGIEAAQAELDLFSSRLRTAHPGVHPEAGHFRLVASPLLDEVLGGARPALWMLFAAVLLVLVIACANVAGLMLMRATAREHELRCARPWAHRGRLIWQNLSRLDFGTTVFYGNGSTVGGDSGLAAPWTIPAKKDYRFYVMRGGDYIGKVLDDTTPEELPK